MGYYTYPDMCDSVNTHSLVCAHVCMHTGACKHAHTYSGMWEHALPLPHLLPPPHTHLCVPSCCHAGMIWLVYVAFYPEINHISFYYKCATVRPGAGDCTAALIILSPVLRPQRVAESCDNNCRHAVLFKRAFRRKVIYTDMATRNHLLLVLLP